MKPFEIPYQTWIPFAYLVIRALVRKNPIHQCYCCSDSIKCITEYTSTVDLHNGLPQTVLIRWVEDQNRGSLCRLRDWVVESLAPGAAPYTTAPPPMDIQVGYRNLHGSFITYQSQITSLLLFFPEVCASVIFYCQYKLHHSSIWMHALACKIALPVSDQK